MLNELKLLWKMESLKMSNLIFNSPLFIVQLPSCVQLFAAPWTAEHQPSLSSTISRSLLMFRSIKLVLLSNHIILCQLLFLSSIFPSIRVFSNELVLHFRWPKYWNFRFSISPSNEYSLLFILRNKSFHWFVPVYFVWICQPTGLRTIEKHLQI